MRPFSFTPTNAAAAAAHCTALHCTAPSRRACEALSESSASLCRAGSAQPTESARPQPPRAPACGCASKQTIYSARTGSAGLSAYPHASLRFAHSSAITAPQRQNNGLMRAPARANIAPVRERVPHDQIDVLDERAERSVRARVDLVERCAVCSDGFSREDFGSVVAHVRTINVTESDARDANARTHAH